MTAKNTASAIWKWLARVQQYIVVFSLVASLGFVFAEVLLRNFIKTSLFGTSELAIMSSWWFYLIGASVGAWERSHIKADILLVFAKRIPHRMAQIRVVSSVLSFLLCAAATSWAFIYINRALDLGRVSFYLRIPMIYAQIPILVGLILMSFYFLVQLVDHVLQLAGKRPIEAYMGDTN